MERVRWPDNICTVGWTCIHGWFTRADVDILFGLCPTGSLTPTFYEPGLGTIRRGELSRLDVVSYKWPHGFYFNFCEAEGEALLNYLRARFPLQRGEGCA